MFTLNSNIEAVVERFRAKKALLQNVDPSEALLAGINAAIGAMKNRIFNEGMDAEGNSLGKYMGRKTRFSKTPTRELTGKETKVKNFLFGDQSAFSEYELKRIGAGRQVKKKDLEFDGTLRRGIIPIKESARKVSCIIPNDELFNIARSQEEQVGRLTGTGTRKIFSLSKEERKILRENTNEALKQLYAKVFNS